MAVGFRWDLVSKTPGAGIGSRKWMCFTSECDECNKQPESLMAGHEGQCQCGAVRYRLICEPSALYICHCLDCQKQSSSAFGISLWVPRESFELLGNAPKIWATTTASGSTKACAFCENCGSRIYHCSGQDDAVLSVKAGTLLDTSWLKPSAQLWRKRAQPWLACLDDAIPLTFAEEPADEQLLEEAWQRALSGD